MSPSNVSAYANLLKVMGAPMLLETQKHRCEPKYNKLQYIIGCYRVNSEEYLTQFDEISYSNISTFLCRLEEKEQQLILSEKKDVENQDRSEWMKEAAKTKDPNLGWTEWKRIKDEEWNKLRFALVEKDTVIAFDENDFWNGYREEYYRKHGIHLQHVSDLAINYIRSWCCIWHLMTRGSADWSYCMTFSPFIVDMVEFNIAPCWNQGFGWHLTLLAQLILFLPPQKHSHVARGVSAF